MAAAEGCGYGAAVAVVLGCSGTQAVAWEAEIHALLLSVHRGGQGAAGEALDCFCEDSR